jgi:hypothetical protein
LKALEVFTFHDLFVYHRFWLPFGSLLGFDHL